MRNERILLLVIVAGMMAAGLIGGCNSSSPGDPAVRGTDGGRPVDSSQSDDTQFDPDHFMGGFQGSPTP